MLSAELRYVVVLPVLSTMFPPLTSIIAQSIFTATWSKPGTEILPPCISSVITIVLRVKLAAPASLLTPTVAICVPAAL